jgi:hypothetical protein
VPEQLGAAVQQLIEHVDDLRAEVAALRKASEQRVATERAERRRSIRRFALLGVYVLLAVGGTLGGFALSNRASINNLHDTIDGDCPAFAAIGTLDVPATAAPVLHRIIDSQRGAYNRRCVDIDGPLPPVRTITPSLTR